MATVTSLLVLASFVLSCATFVIGVRVGHGSSTLGAHMTLGALTLVVQLFALCVATIHARHSEQQIALLRAALEKEAQASPSASRDESRPAAGGSPDTIRHEA